METTDRTRLNTAFGRLADGDRAAAREVFDTLWPVVHRFCARAIGGGTGADDLAQQALVRLFEQASEFDRDRDALAWALEIAAWQCRTERRRRGRSKEGALEPAFDAPVAHASPELTVETVELHRALDAALADLPERDRETLRAVLDESGEGGATWRKRKERALARLRLVWRTVHGD